MTHLSQLNCRFESLPQLPFTIRIQTREGQRLFTVTDTMLNLVKMEVTLRLLELDTPVAYQPDEMECLYSFLPN